MKIIEKLKTIDVDLYPKLWCEFNSWGWPEELEELKPDNWDILPISIQHNIINDSQRFIESIVSEKELLRYANRHRMNSTEFEIWWANRKPLSETARKILRAIYEDQVLKDLN